ncbi:hypothetical protein HDA40_005793 [Hamadaea flava]|uniref:YciI family protein n=1 Tax=Hamadaea flava TaxID=1742688 RepID=A0ABV8LQC1_9ACTN|nr:YciI family protein [Hamadaea flava]MCP2327286.1 hypothetical protein [Hamadaea flava]
MRVMVIIKSDENAEAGVLPGDEVVGSMIKYNEELIKAGVMLAGEGLHPSVKGARVTFKAGKATVVDGPFAEAKELIAGFWLWQVKSMDEAVEWVKRMPASQGTSDDQVAEIEIRQVFENEEFDGQISPELQEQDARQRSGLQ